MNDFIAFCKPILEMMRLANPALGVVALALVGYRLAPALVRYWEARATGGITVFQRQERNARLLFLGYVSTGVLGSAQAIYLKSRVGPATLILFILHCPVILVMARWQRGEDHPLEGTR